MDKRNKKNTNVWIMNHYATNTFDDKAGRHYLFAKYLNKAGYNTTVFCANTFHDNRKSIDINDGKYIVNRDENTRFVFVKTSEYKGNGLSRIKNMLTFAKNLKKVAKIYSKTNNENPDVIIASSVHPLTCVAGIKMAKKMGVPCIVEIRDLWPESIVEYSSRLTKKNPIIKLLYMGEKWIYKKADKIIFTMEGGADYIKEQGWDKDIDMSKIYHINNGVDLEVFDYNKENFQIEDDDLKNDNIFKVVYTGSIRKVNNLGILLDSAKKIEETKIKFLIWGDGNELEELQQRVIDEKIDNVVLKGRVDKKYIPYILSKADCNFMGGKVSRLSRFGMSQNKLFDYFAAGKPILTKKVMKYNLIEMENCGVVYDEDTIGIKIKELCDMEKTYKDIIEDNCKNMRMRYDFKELTENLIKILEK